MTGYEIKEQEERVILVGIALSENDLTDESLDELAELARTAKAAVVGRLVQGRENIRPRMSGRESWQN